LQAGGRRFDPGWLHQTRLNANRGHAEGRFDLIACIYADSVDHGLEYALDALAVRTGPLVFGSRVSGRVR
jgi:hypothetical protein